MPVEALVLERHEHGEVALVDLVGLEREPPATFGGGKGAQKPLVAVEHGDRDLAHAGKLWNAQPVDGRVECGDAAANQQHDGREHTGHPEQHPSPSHGNGGRGRGPASLFDLALPRVGGGRFLSEPSPHVAPHSLGATVSLPAAERAYRCG